MSLAKPTFVLVFALGLSACAMEVASGDGPGHDPGTTQQTGPSDVQLKTKGGSHAQDATAAAPGSTTPGTGAVKPKGDPAGIMDRPQPEPWVPTTSPTGTTN